MNSVRIEPAAWPRRRWIALGALVLAAHVGLIFWLRELPDKARPPARPLVVHWAITPRLQQRLAELPALSDPTLFALPNENSFSGAAWLKFAPLQHRLKDWSELPNWLTQRVDYLGKVFSQFVATSAPPPYLIADKPLPLASVLDVGLPAAAVETQSVLRLEANLAQRRLITPVMLANQSYTEILTNSVVQVMVNADGLVSSARLLTGCGLEEADQTALVAARAMRFGPIRRRAEADPERLSPQTTVGNLVFEWHTVPVASTNAPAAAP